MTIKKLIDLASKKIGYINSKILIKFVLKENDQYIIVNNDLEIEEQKEKEFLNYVNKVEEGYPLQYITNKQEFMGLDFYVNENVLIPQPDTELLVEKAIEYSNNLESCKILDLCTGSGAIAISLKKYVPKVSIFASDISSEALSVAKKNSIKNNVQINFIKSNMFENIKETFDIIVSNPPYIKTNVIKNLSKDVKNEPIIALDGGEDGLYYYKIIAKNVNKYLKENGILIMEIGYDQGEEVKEIFQNSICIKDYENNDRVIIWKRSQKK